MKKSVAQYISRYLICQQIKAEYQRTTERLQPLAIPQWKWEKVTMDFVMGLSRSPKESNTIWVIVDR